MRKSYFHGVLILMISTMWLITASCATVTTHHKSSSIVQYLYPDKKDVIETPGIPRLELPLRIGIAFIPDGFGALTEQEKMELMLAVSRHFKKYDFVKSIELIPSAYLTAEGGFTNLDQIRTMYGIDVVTLISYDQTQFTDEGLASISYWTLIGAYIIKGEKNATHTMVDATVYDIPSRKMLFRAPGTNFKKSKATPVNLSEQLRADSVEGFKKASVDLVENLDVQLGLFKEKVKEAPEDYQVVNKPGYTGGGSLDAPFIVFLSIAGGCLVWLKKNRKAE